MTMLSSHVERDGERAGLELPRLPLAIVDFQARATGSTPLPPYIGTTLRGAFGGALRSIACTTGAATCAGCPRLALCAYGATWEGAGVDRGALGALDRGDQNPRPYVIAWDRPPRRGSGCLAEGDPLRFRLVIVGRARDFLPQYILAIRDALATGLGPERRPLVLEHALTAGPADRLGMPSARGLRLFADGHIQPWMALPETTLWSLALSASAGIGSRARLLLRTPLALVQGDRLLDTVSLEVLCQRLVERINSLAFGWGPGGGRPLDHLALGDLARRAHVVATHVEADHFERVSRRSSGRVPMRGLVGRLDLSSLHPALVRLFAAAAWVHAGKQATFGFGRVEIVSSGRGSSAS